MKRLMTIVYVTGTSLLLTIACKSTPVAEGEMPLNQMPPAESTDNMGMTTSPDGTLPADSATAATTPETAPEEPMATASSSLPEPSMDTASSDSSSVPDEVTKVAGLGASSSGRSR